MCSENTKIQSSQDCKEEKSDNICIYRKSDKSLSVQRQLPSKRQLNIRLLIYLPYKLLNYYPIKPVVK